MITKLEISNFKSVRNATLDCKKVNIFIGEPNTGKSNILESLAFYSAAYYMRYGSMFHEFVRHEKTADLFYDTDIQSEAKVTTHLSSGGYNSFSIKFQNGQYASGLSTSLGGVGGNLYGDRETMRSANLNPIGEGFLPKYKFYKYVEGYAVGRPEGVPLLPPSGSNLHSILLMDRDLRNLISSLISRYGLKLGLRPNEAKIELVRQAEDVIVSYPFVLISDTFKRLIFFLAAVVTNKASILVFEEPESHAFPYYTKYLAEKIVSDGNQNQYFMSTHNPYFLQALVARGNFEDVRVFVTRFENYQTTVTTLNENDMSLLMQMDVDVFFQLDKFVGEKSHK